MGETSVDGGLPTQEELQLVFPDIQTKEFQCPICAKYFSRKFTLDAHMLIHKGEKPHMCQFCGKSFRQKGTLMRHKALHSSKNLFHCSLCNRGFRQKNVFIHHLRHRHNVSTETLDRRKYRTEPKDYQSIMDTLPPFVHADSTAIASSGKHFDDLLLKSIQTSVSDPFESSQDKCVRENEINSTLSALNNAEQLISISEQNMLCSVTSHKPKMVIDDEDYLEDIKPVFNNNISEINPSVLSISSVVSEVPQKTNPSMLVADSHSDNVTSSNDIIDESIICIPCHLSFNNESEFKCHMKTHVQSVLLGDVNSNDLASHDLNCHVSSDSTTSLNSVLPSSSSTLVSQSDEKTSQKQNDNSLSIRTAPVKIEISDSEIDNCLSSKETNIEPELSLSSSSISELLKSNKFYCPDCKIFLQEEGTFKKHSEKYDSYLLLKLYCESVGAVNLPCGFRNPVSEISSKSPCLENHNTDSSKQKSEHTEQNNSRKIVIKSRLNKKKCATQYQCAQCKKRFLNKTVYAYHQQLHLSVKGFRCQCCKKTFSTKMLLLSHTRLKHFKTFSCPKCSRIFNYRKLFDFHKKRCIYNYDVKTSNGSQINFPIVSIESLLNSDVDGIVGIIPVCSNSNANGNNSVKIGIPVMSIPQIKALYLSSSNNSKW